MYNIMVEQTPCKTMKHPPFMAQEFLPKSFAQMFHMARIIFLSQHKVRMMVPEGNKRTTATIYALMDFEPNPGLKPRWNTKEKNSIQGVKNPLRENQGPSKPYWKPSPFKRILSNANNSIAVNMLYPINKETNELQMNLSVLTKLVKLSQMTADAVNTSQSRCWRLFVLGKLEDPKFVKRWIPQELKFETEDQEEGLKHR